MATMEVTAGAVKAIKGGETSGEPPVLQVLDLKQQDNGRFRLSLTDGCDKISAVLASQLAVLAEEGKLKNLSVLKATEFSLNMAPQGQMVLLTDCQVVGQRDDALLPSAENGEDVKPAPASAHKTPVARKENAMPHLTPPSDFKIKLSAAGRQAQPIQSLNPYNSNFTIKAKLVSKAPKRSFSGKTGEARSVFNVELIDEHGTSIEATLWGDLADKYHDVLQEGKVYMVSKGKVRPANKQYSTVRNDYCLNLDSNIGTEIEECSDQDTSKMQAKMVFVPIDNLSAHIGKKAPIDVVGVCTNVAPLASVKRKTDGSELSRRDITLVDQSGKSVAVTLWGTAAEKYGPELEAMDAPIVAITSCRVTDFNGVSLSGLQRSVVVVEPKAAETDKLREWWAATGSGASFTPAGEGLPTAIKAGRGERVSSTLEAVLAATGSANGGKGDYFTVPCTVAAVDPEQNMYYMANPENNRKVVEKDGAYYCEYDDKTYPSMVRRYVMRVQVLDFTGALGQLNVFNDEGEQLVGMKADELAEYKEGRTDGYQAVLKRAQFTEWSMRIQARSREYNGEARVQYSLQSLTALDYVKECRQLLSGIAKYTS